MTQHQQQKIKKDLKIQPLEKALSSTQILKIVFGTSGNFDRKDNKDNLRKCAEVRFIPINKTCYNKVESLVVFLTSEFLRFYSFAPITLKAYKMYLPNTNHEIDPIFVIELEIFDETDTLTKRREDTNKAILDTIKLVDLFVSSDFMAN